MIRPPKGPGVAFRRAVGGGRSRVYAGNSITNSAGSIGTTMTLRDVPTDTLNEGDDNLNVDFDDGDNSEDGGDDRELIKRQGKRINARNLSRDGRGRGSGRANGHGRTNNVREQNVDRVDTRTGETYESYRRLVVKKYGDDASLHPEFDMELWSSIAGGKKKRRLYGTSNITDPYIVLTGALSKSNNGGYFPSGSSNKQVQLLEDKIAGLEREKKKSRNEEKQKKMQCWRKLKKMQDYMLN